MEDEFTSKERKKAFDKIFKDKIQPFFEKEGFRRHTKTSKRLYKEFEDGLSVFIFLEYKNTFGIYDMTIVYFDEELGTVYDDNYLAISSFKIPSLSGDSFEELNLAADEWISFLRSSVVPFIDGHSTHKSILESDHFYKATARKEAISEVLNRKSGKG